MRKKIEIKALEQVIETKEEDKNLEILLMPRIVDSLEQGIIIKNHCKVGDVITQDTIIFDVRVHGTNYEMGSKYSGTIRSFFVKPGDEVKDDDELCSIDTCEN